MDNRYEFLNSRIIRNHSYICNETVIPLRSLGYIGNAMIKFLQHITNVINQLPLKIMTNNLNSLNGLCNVPVKPAH